MLRMTLASLAVLVAVARADTLQQRIDAAPPGATIEVDAGVHAPIRTDKPIRLIGRGRPVIDGGGAADCVTLAGPDSELRGFVIRNSGSDLDRESTGLRVLGARTLIQDNVFEDVLFGIDLKSASDCVIRDNRIGSKPLEISRRGDALRLFRSDRCLIEGNTIEDGRDALLWYSDHVAVRRNISRRNRYGFHMMFANHVTLEDNIVTDNSVGIYLMYGKEFVIRRNDLSRNRGPSGYGLGLKEVDRYEVSGNLFTGNRVGAYIDGSPMVRRLGTATFTGNSFVCNDIALTFLPAVRGNAIHANNFVDNVAQVAVSGRGALRGNEFAVDGRGNFWSDFAGYDADRDGIGDQPYASRRLFESLADREPALRFLLFSPAHDAIEFIGRALPAMQPAPKLTDPAPLSAPVAMPAVRERPRSSDRFGLASACLLAIAGLVAAGALVPEIAWRRARQGRAG